MASNEKKKKTRKGSDEKRMSGGDMQDSDKRQSAFPRVSFLSCSGNVVFFFFGYTVSSGSSITHNLKFRTGIRPVPPAIEASSLTTGPSESPCSCRLECGKC